MPQLYRLREPLFIGAAGNDPLIPIRQACALREVRLRTGRAVAVGRQNRDGTPPTTPARSDRRCPAERPRATFPSGGDPDVFMLVSDLPHRSSPRMWLATEQFLARHLALPNPVWAFFRRLFGR